MRVGIVCQMKHFWWKANWRKMRKRRKFQLNLVTQLNGLKRATICLNYQSCTNNLNTGLGVGLLSYYILFITSDFLKFHFFQQSNSSKEIRKGAYGILERTIKRYIHFKTKRSCFMGHTNSRWWYTNCLRLARCIGKLPDERRLSRSTCNKKKMFYIFFKRKLRVCR